MIMSSEDFVDALHANSFVKTIVKDNGDVEEV